jgi:hypothetical protein
MQALAEGTLALELSQQKFSGKFLLAFGNRRCVKDSDYMRSLPKVFTSIQIPISAFVAFHAILTYAKMGD